MQKGKFGFSLWIYPFLALWAASTRVFWVPFLIAGVVLVVEKEEWAIKQCLHTLVITLLYSTYNLIMTPLAQIPNSTDIGSMLSSGKSPMQWGSFFSTIDIVVSIGFLVLMVLMGMLRLIKGENISFWGMGIVNRAYGFIQQTVTVPAPSQPPFTAPTPPAPAQHTQPTPPPYTPPETPAPAPPQYTQPAPPPYTPPTPPPSAPQYTQPTPPPYVPPTPPAPTPPPPAPSVHSGFVPPSAPPSGGFVPPSAPPVSPPQPNQDKTHIGDQ